MGYSTISIPFFVETITIRPHTASNGKWLNRSVSIRQFAKGKRVSLEQVQETEEYIVRLESGEFMQGPEVEAKRRGD